VTRFPVRPPAGVQSLGATAVREAQLGRLGPALQWLGRAQGAWPPAPPRSVRTVVVGDLAPGSAGRGGSGDASDEPGGAALDAGVAEADVAADDGVDLIVLGSSADAVPGLVTAAVLLGLEPVEAVGTTGGADWAARTVGVRRGVLACRQHRDHVEALLAALASPPLGRLTGLLAQSAVRRTPVVLDGSPLVLGAGLLASRLAPGAQAWWLAGQAPPAPGAAKALSSLGLEPVLDLRLERPEGAALAYGLLMGSLGMLGH